MTTSSISSKVGLARRRPKTRSLRRLGNMPNAKGLGSGPNPMPASSMAQRRPSSRFAMHCCPGELKMGKALNLQDMFLNQVRKEGLCVTIYLMGGIQLKGNVRGFDAFTVLLDS